MTKTRTEIEKLKRDWRDDPCWDLPETEGFEEHREELQAYQQQAEDEWRRAYTTRAEKKAEELGCPGNLMLGKYALDLEHRLKTIEEKLSA